jgi:hypothetical protein
MNTIAQNHLKFNGQALSYSKKIVERETRSRFSFSLSVLNSHRSKKQQKQRSPLAKRDPTRMETADPASE